MGASRCRRSPSCRPIVWRRDPFGDVRADRTFQILRLFCPKEAKYDSLGQRPRTIRDAKTDLPPLLFSAPKGPNMTAWGNAPGRFAMRKRTYPAPLSLATGQRKRSGVDQKSRKLDRC